MMLLIYIYIYIYNAKIKRIKNEMPSFSNLVIKTDYETKMNKTEKKITDHNHDKYINTPEFNKLTSENLAARLKQTSLVILLIS